MTNRSLLRIKRKTRIFFWRLSNDILFLSKIDQEWLRWKELCDIALLCKSRCDIAKEKLEQRYWIHFLKGSNEVCTVETDSYLITRILDNMLNNAVKFTEKGYIKVNYSYEEGSLVLFVEDTGCGIDKDMRNKVFDRFVKQRIANGGLSGIKFLQSHHRTHGWRNSSWKWEGLWYHCLGKYTL